MLENKSVEPESVNSSSSNSVETTDSYVLTDSGSTHSCQTFWIISETRKDRGKVTMDTNGTIPDPLRPPLPQNLGFAITTENFNLKFRANEC